MRDREPAYDEHIAPLMAQIIAICKEHDIPLVACFQLSDGTDGDGVPTEDGPLFCTTSIPAAWQDAKLTDVVRTLYRRADFAAITIVSEPA